MKRSRDHIFYCFSPLVMIVTFVIEIMLVLYAISRFHSRLYGQLLILLLLCLASFQLAEYQVCEYPDSNILWWTKLGLVGITMLPAIGLHMVTLVTARSKVIWFGYAFALLFAATFLFVPGATESASCHANYVMLHIQDGFLSIIYHAYYAIFVLLAVIALINNLIHPTKKATTHPIAAWTLAGYLSFTVPMGIVGFLYPAYVAAAPSVMCGFAVLLALILTLRAAPLYFKTKK